MSSSRATKNARPAGDELLVEDVGKVRKIIFNAPERRNPLSFSVAEKLHDILLDSASDDAVRAIVLTGSGKAFCVGGDQRDFQAGFERSSPEVLADYPPAKVFRLARTYRKPLVAAVNGAAFGGGMGITCVAHMAIASETATFGIPEIKLGIFPLTILPIIRPVLGDRLTMDLALTGRSMDAAEAKSVGVVNRIVPAETLMDEALALAGQIASFSPLALRLGIEAMQTSTDMGFDEAMDYLNAMRTIFFSSEDLNEGARAFLEKRKPVWRGR